jgi:hypothetical protein
MAEKSNQTLLQRCKCPNNGLFIVALMLLVTFLFIEVVARSYNLYQTFPDIDVPSHFFAGMAICSGAFWIMSLNQIRRKKLAAVLCTFAAAIVWEILETIEEMVIPNSVYLRDIFFWDGFFDIFFTVLGGIFVFVFLYIIKRRTNLLCDIKI